MNYKTCGLIYTEVYVFIYLSMLVHGRQMSCHAHRVSVRQWWYLSLAMSYSTVLLIWFISNVNKNIIYVMLVSHCSCWWCHPRLSPLGLGGSTPFLGPLHFGKFLPHHRNSLVVSPPAEKNTDDMSCQNSSPLTPATQTVKSPVTTRLPKLYTATTSCHVLEANISIK